MKNFTSFMETTMEKKDVFLFRSFWMMLKSKIRPRLNGEHAAATISTTINILYSTGPFLVETKKHNRWAAVEEKGTAARKFLSSPPPYFPPQLSHPYICSIQQYQQYKDISQWWQIIFNLNIPIQWINMKGENWGTSAKGFSMNIKFTKHKC